VWNPEVRRYAIHDSPSGKFLGSFYADWYPRENKRGGAWMDALITGGPVTGGFQPHLGLICGNLTPPIEEKPALLTHRERFSLFRRAMGVLWEGVAATRALYTYFGHIDGLYPAILDLPVDILGLDFVAGARNWDVLRSAPFTKQLGLGIVDARNTKMETPEAVADGVRRATEFVHAHHLHVGPTAGLDFLPRTVARRKLEVLAAGVRRVQGEAA